MTICFNEAFFTKSELNYIVETINNKHTAGDGPFTHKCHQWLEKKLSCKKALLTHSCTAALEMAAILIDIKPDDEVIMPSYTFVSTANAFVLRGAVPVFVDIRPDTLNIDETKIEAAITEKTKAIVPVHYAGVACEMDVIMKIAKKHNLYVIEDAAQAILSKYKGQNLGTVGDFGTLSFHETKNIISGEGGALLINNENFIDRAEIIREKGTNRSKFFRGQVDKYTWVDIGSSYLPSDIIAAFLYSQFEFVEEIIKKRLKLWQKYDTALRKYEKRGIIKCPFVPKNVDFNAHIYHLIFNSSKIRDDFIRFLKQKDIQSVFHYIPLHSSPAGQKYSKVFGDMTNTNYTSDNLVRLPLFYNLTNDEVDYIIDNIEVFLKSI